MNNLTHHEIGMDLARLSGRDPAELGKAAARQWAARGLALQALARGDMDEALKVMAPFNTGEARNG